MIRRLSYTVVGLALLAILLAVAGYSYVAADLPDPVSLRDVRLQVPMRIYSADGLLLGEFGEQKRVPVAFDDLPRDLINAVLAAEDDRFFRHSGVDYAGLTRAAFELVRTGEKRQGGSTITMQVARNFFLGREKTYLRKAREIILALRIDRELSKEEIFALYANKIFLGHRAYGFAAAAQVYFDKPLDMLDVADVALLAGLPKAPSRFNPIADPERARVRRDYVLDRMLELGFISAEQHEKEIARRITARLHSLPIQVAAPYVAEMVRVWALEQFGPAAYTDGLSIYTTLCSRLQALAQQSLQVGLRAYDRRHGYRGALANHGDLATVEAARELLDVDQLGDGLERAVITRVDHTQAQAVTAFGSVSLDLEAVAWARPFIDVNRRGRTPRAVDEVLAAGDEVLLEFRGGAWKLSQRPLAEGAAIALAPDDGAIRALVGGYSFQRSHFNRVVQAERQPGSNFKPFLYSAALRHGYTPASLVNDAPVVFSGDTLAGDWRPENYSGQFFGPTRLRVALAKSRNLVSVRLASEIGVDHLRDHAMQFGFPAEKLPRNLSLALGSGAMTPLEVVRGYAVIANGGFLVEPHLVEHVESQQGEVLWATHAVAACRLCPESATEQADAGQGASVRLPGRRVAPRVQSAAENFILTTMLQEVIRSGTGRRALSLGRGDLAGKTGTTNDQKDAWFSGFNPELAATVWIGFDRPARLGRNETGAHAALPVWIDFMRGALAGRPEISLPQPPGVITARIDPQSGLLAESGQPDAIFEYFQAGLLPAAPPDSGSRGGVDEAGAVIDLF